MYGLSENIVDSVLWQYLFPLVRFFGFWAVLLFSFDVAIRFFEKQFFDKIKKTMENMAVTYKNSRYSMAGRLQWVIISMLRLMVAALLTVSRKRYFSRNIALLKSDRLPYALIPLMQPALFVISILLITLFNFITHTPLIGPAGFLLLAIGLVLRLASRKRQELAGMGLAACGLVLIAAGEMFKAGQILAALPGNGLLPENYIVLGLCTLVFSWMTGSAMPAIVVILTLSGISVLSPFFALIALSLTLMGSNLAVMDVARKNKGQAGCLHGTIFTENSILLLNIIILSFLSFRGFALHNSFWYPLLLLPIACLSLIIAFIAVFRQKEEAVGKRGEQDSADIMLYNLADNEFEQCKAPEKLEATLGVIRTSIALCLQTVTSLVLELLNASQLENETKTILKTIEQTDIRLNANIAILKEALGICLSVSVSAPVRQETSRLEKILDALRNLVHICVAIARILSKLSRKKAHISDENLAIMFNLIAALSDLLNYLSAYLTNGLASLDAAVLEHLSAAIGDSRMELQEQTMRTLQSDAATSSRADLAVMEINQKFSSAADLVLLIARLETKND